MRKARFKMVLFGLLATLTLMLFAAERGQAQTLKPSALPKSGGASSSTIAPPVNYISAPEAISLLQAQTTALKNFMGTLIPGTQPYKTVETSYMFYTMIWSGIVSGKTLPDSIQEGMSLFQYPDYVNTPSSQILSLYQEAVDMLSN
ncbi:MAG: hypothetical protein IPJ00_10140 [Saprospirales bacterium]|jgi:hypothetical protein|nr:hypothetical protein [Saprospirales bacterium]MBK7336502.1 hypothetical protein [Saprospirales bacterium]